MKFSRICFIILVSLELFVVNEAVHMSDQLVFSLLVLIANHEINSKNFIYIPDDSFINEMDRAIDKKIFSPRMGKRYFSPRMGKRYFSPRMGKRYFSPRMGKRYFSPRLGK
uniref:Pyrokinin prohormone like-1 n=1 Tax=Schmidtea mediterranea TaxID=79327 RepID=E3CTI2_SCHMD|nr:TPA_inf: pyrokinin prohormone like-1 [Schmidtea mediterranea]